MSEEATKKSRRGFAAMDPEKRRAIASLGGKRAHEMGVAHCFDSEKAREAGTKGGRAYHKKRGRTVIVGDGQKTLEQVFAEEQHPGE